MRIRFSPEGAEFGSSHDICMTGTRSALGSIAIITVIYDIRTDLTNTLSFPHPLSAVIMGKTYDHIPTKLIEWIREQEVFWVATAPLAESGHINVSPKGVRGTFHVDGPNKGGSLH